MPGPVDDLDHAGSYELAQATSSASTRPASVPDEGYARDWPPEIRSDAATRATVSARWAEYGLGDLAKRGTADAWSGQGAARLAPSAGRAAGEPGRRRRRARSA